MKKKVKFFFNAFSDALISKGLASILIEVYTGLSPKDILMNSPVFIKDLGILSSLTPGRANGIASLHLKMKQEALRLAVDQEVSS